MQGQQITPEMLSVVEMGSYNLPGKAITDVNLIIGKYAVSNLFAGSLVYPEMLSEMTDSSDSMLRNLKENEIVMSVTIKNLAFGVSGKLMTGDVIRIVSVDSEKNATIYDELLFIEVFATTTGGGNHNINNQPEADENGDINLPVTITVILQDNLQALRLAECENTNLHAIFVSRDETLKDDYIKMQVEILEEIKEAAEEAERAMNSELLPFGGEYFEQRQ
jgi:pilus assembly protein CpaB